MPRGTARDTCTSVSALTIPLRSSGTSSVPPASVLAPSPSAAAASSTVSGRRSRNLGPPPLALARLAERPQHLLAVDRERAHVGAGRVADRVRDRGGRRHDRRLAQALRAEVRQVLG